MWCYEYTCWGCEKLLGSCGFPRFVKSQQAQPGPHVPIIVLAAACDAAAWAAKAEQTKHDTLSLYSTTLTLLHGDADRVVVWHLQERALVGRLAQTVENA